MEEIELIREVLAQAQLKGVEGSSAAMESLVRLNTKLLNVKEELDLLDGKIAHG